jgi:hypothetical protein
MADLLFSTIKMDLGKVMDTSSLESFLVIENISNNPV